MCFWSSLINLMSKDANMIFYFSRWIIIRKGVKSVKEMNEKQTEFCSELLTSRRRDKWVTLFRQSQAVITTMFSMSPIFFRDRF